MLDYIVLGIVQGVTEWLPISSEGMVSLLSELFGLDEPVNTALFLHAGTLLAAIWYFRDEWRAVVAFERPRLARVLAIATAVSLPIGFVLHSYVAVTTGSTIFIITGLGLVATAALHAYRASWHLGEDTTAFITGVLQGCAVIPGVSRSGSTFFGLSLHGYEPEELLTISYMLSVPVVAASTCYLLFTAPVVWEAWPALVASALTGVASLRLVVTWSKQLSFTPFLVVMGVLSISAGLL
jgi:undecaprenyl-diphosphatase